MAETKTLLVVIDPTAKEHPALERAEQLARKLDASLELFVCDYDQYLAGERFFDSRSLESARRSLVENHVKRLEKLAQQVGDDLTVTVDAAWDRPLHEGIVRKVIRSRPTFVVKDTHYHSALKRSIFSNTDWELIRACPAPLFLVKPQPWREAPAIIASVDPTHSGDKPAELDHAILDLAGHLADRLEATLHAFHAFDTLPVYAFSIDAAVFPVQARDEIAKGVRRTREESMQALMTSYPAVEASNIHLVEGNTRDALCDLAAKTGAAVVVMGAVSRRGLQRIVLGSTAESVLDFVPCDLVIVKPPGFVTPVAAD